MEKDQKDLHGDGVRASTSEVPQEGGVLSENQEFEFLPSCRSRRCGGLRPRLYDGAVPLTTPVILFIESVLQTDRPLKGVFQAIET
ncbi:hypothetical protein J437_LFUL018613 [Ladona fulva]|uniref:Uncharacterized protein n=1 Tax=Ladona fulva TaxID=123851 RepID=A0A8K0KQY6_LADFU|nr:hypothetical protein J437_LFUL018613 [Ladona fulva]